MKQSVFILLFLTGFIPLSHSVTRKYYLILTAKSWNDAQTFCRTKHTDLATIENAAEAAKLNIEAKRLGFSSWAWIGLYMDLSDYVWSYGSQKLGTASFWQSGEPNGGTLELCIAIYYSLWVDFSCSKTMPFVCIDERNSGTDRYIYYSMYYTWNQARNYCWTYHTDMASARDANEISIISAKITDSNMTTWIGLYKNAAKWSDHTPYTSFTMYPGEPNTASDLCILSLNALGNDQACNYAYPFFCYRAVTSQRRYIRMKIQSDQDIDDPAVKTALLQKIVQKLAEHQIITNITLTWRSAQKLNQS